MRTVLAFLAAALLATTAAHAQLSPCATAGNDNGFLNIQTIRLWPGPAPQARGNACEDIPTLTIVNPRKGSANGSAVIILPGGAYRGLAGDLEGGEVASWFTARGFRAFILSYRLTSHGYLLPVPLLDARRAVQLVRAHASEYQINPNRIVMIGFSAGGHLAALAATQPVAGKPDAEDPIDRVSSRPDYLVLGYAWLGAITTDTSHLSYCKLFNVMDQCDALKAAYTPALYVTKDTPPTFMYQTFTDQTVPVQQALTFFDALVKAGVTSELHVFANGPHGTGLGKGDPALDKWPSLLENWLRPQGLLTVDKDAVEGKE
ncbi:MAG TPA: alpha/beta hydrolase [Terracidiphilus sp.]|nr:alpha/beta hydrolase [Terracidiphilus sp.]